MAGGLAYEIAFWNKIYPGVSIANISVGNLTPDQAQALLAQQLTLERNLELVWGTSRWSIPINTLGVEYHFDQSASQAFAMGRHLAPWPSWRAKVKAWKNGVHLDPAFSVDENRIAEAVASVSAQIDIPAQEPGVSLDNGAVVVLAGENGQAVDARKLLQLIKQAIAQTTSAEIPVPVKELLPKLSEAESQVLQSRAQKFVDRQMIIRLENQTWAIPSQQIVSWIDPVTPTTWRQDAISTWAQELAQAVNRPAENALFTYLGDGRVKEFKPALEGITVNQSEFANNVMASLSSLGESSDKSVTIEIPVARVPPAITTAEVNNLGIKELIARGDSNYTGSIPNRVFNLHKAANYMNGVLVAPGEEFSFNKYVGDISASGGYKQAYVIKQGRTVLGDGGGVCQVSTTMFRAALAAGLPITERHAHAYRVHYYENDSQPGFDATIFTPNVDFKFKNDTPGYILIQTVFDDAHNKLAFEFYGTKDGRQVTLSKSRVWDVTPPPPALYQDDATLAMGVVQQVDFPAWGAKASFDYKVVRDGQVLQQQTFYSNYSPWQAIYLRGTKTN